MSGFGNDEKNCTIGKDLTKKLADFAETGVQGTERTVKYLLSHADIPDSIQSQMDILSCVSNYHWETFPNSRRDGYTSEKTHIGYAQHFSHATSVDDADGRYTGHKPSSPRNRLIYNILSDQADDQQFSSNITRLIKQYLPDIFGLENYSFTKPDCIPKRRANAGREPLAPLDDPSDLPPVQGLVTELPTRLIRPME